jgi:hypothetical protein
LGLVLIGLEEKDQQKQKTKQNKTKQNKTKTKKKTTTKQFDHYFTQGDRFTKGPKS